MRENMSRKAQDIDLRDIFSESRQVGLSSNDKTLNAYIQEAFLAARQALNVLNFPILPKLNYNNAKYVKYSSYDPTAVVGAEILFNLRMATVTGSVRHAVIPVSVSAGMVVPPSIMIYDGKPWLIGQTAVDAIVQRNSSYALQPMRGMFDPPLTGEELDQKVLERYERGYEPREIDMDADGVRRTYRRSAGSLRSSDPALQVLTDSGWQWVFSHGEDTGEINLTDDRTKALPGRALDYLSGLHANDEFRIEDPRDDSGNEEYADLYGPEIMDELREGHPQADFGEFGSLQDVLKKDPFQGIRGGVDKEWEPTVKKMKGNPEIDNPWALANSMDNKGYTPGGDAGKDRGQSSGRDAQHRLNSPFFSGYDPEVQRKLIEDFQKQQVDQDVPVYLDEDEWDDSEQNPDIREKVKPRPIEASSWDSVQDRIIARCCK
jgi:hypothetical protein